MEIQIIVISQGHPVCTHTSISVDAAIIWLDRFKNLLESADKDKEKGGPHGK